MRTSPARFTLVVAAIMLAACRDVSLVAPEKAGLRVPTPSNMLLGDPIISLSAGPYHTCLRHYHGSTYCWGLDDTGQLGIGPVAPACSAVNLGYPHTVPPYACATVPTLIPNFTFGAISAGENHTCAIQSGQAYCWGGNSGYQLGTGDKLPSNSPRPVASSLAFSSIAAGSYESCGTVEGPAPQGTLVCWGQNHNTIQPYYYTPTVVQPPAGVPADFHGVASSYSMGTVCATWSDYSTLKLYCMGNNDYGMAGVDPQWGYVTLSQVQVTPAANAAIGIYFGCVDQSGGGVACWGDNSAGQLGNPNAGKDSFVPVSVLSSAPLHGVVVASFYACALDSSRNAWCWGAHSFDGTSTSVPTIVANGHTFTALTAGFQHVCGIGTDAHVWCWGDGGVGQLGNGQSGITAPATQPVRVSGT